MKDYDFNIGDKVISVEGHVGKIVDICTCEECKKRGFYEPVWVIDRENNSQDYYERYIDIYQAQAGFPGFYQIGKYHFNEFDKDEVLCQIKFHQDMLMKLNEQLKVIEEENNVRV